MPLSPMGAPHQKGSLLGATALANSSLCGKLSATEVSAGTSTPITRGGKAVQSDVEITSDARDIKVKDHVMDDSVV